MISTRPGANWQPKEGQPHLDEIRHWINGRAAWTEELIDQLRAWADWLDDNTFIPFRSNSMSDSQHTHEDTTYFHEDCPMCRRQRYGNAERTTTESTEVAQTMTTEAALSVPDEPDDTHHYVEHDHGPMTVEPDVVEDGGEGGDDSA